MNVFAPFVADPILYKGQYRSLLPQTAMCLGPFLIFQIGIIILLSLFLAEVVRVTVAGLQKVKTPPKATEIRAQLVAQVSFVLFVLLGCAITWLMYRDMYFP